MPSGKLPHQTEQENGETEVGNEKVLQALPQAHAAQGNKVNLNKKIREYRRVFLFFRAFSPIVQSMGLFFLKFCGSYYGTLKYDI